MNSYSPNHFYNSIVLSHIFFILSLFLHQRLCPIYVYPAPCPLAYLFNLALFLLVSAQCLIPVCVICFSL